MKINRQDVKTAFLLCSQYEYQNIPAEVDIDHSFSATFSQKMLDLCRNNEKTSWRCWNVYRRRVILVAIIVVMLAALVACAPIIEKLYIKYFVVDNGITYGITFDPEQAASAPKTVETYMCPEFELDNYCLVEKLCSPVRVTYIWISDNSEMICYEQCLLPRDASYASWINIDAENTERETISINGYAVELFIADKMNNLIAVWTDNAYMYVTNISSRDSNKIDIVKEIMDSLVAVDPTDYTG